MVSIYLIKINFKFFFKNFFRKPFRVIFNLFLWIIWDLSGIRFICYKILPPHENKAIKRKPSVITIWLITVYLAFFGISLTYYNSHLTSLKDNLFVSARNIDIPFLRFSSFAEIAELQQAVCPSKPILLKPSSLFSCIFGEPKPYNQEITKYVISIIERNRKDLSGLDLYGINLHKAKLSHAKLDNTILTHSILTFCNLESAKLYKAKLMEAILIGANLSSADLRHADLSNAILNHNIHFLGGLKDIHGIKVYYIQIDPLDLPKKYDHTLIGANLSYTNLEYTILKGVDLANVNFEGANFGTNDTDQTIVTAEQLSKCKTLYKAKMSYNLREEIKKVAPHLLKKSKN